MTYSIGKIVCPELDFRCIDPTEYCCDPHVSPDTCKFMYPCCESVIEFSIRSRYMMSVSRVSSDVLSLQVLSIRSRGESRRAREARLRL